MYKKAILNPQDPMSIITKIRICNDFNNEKVPKMVTLNLKNVNRNIEKQSESWAFKL
jgi:hypothetical protein